LKKRKNGRVSQYTIVHYLYDGVMLKGGRIIPWGEIFLTKDQFMDAAQIGLRHYTKEK
jgi:hypothetical protein